MMKILRRIIFFLFAAVFVVGAPKIVFYALGYSYGSGSEKGLIQTGLIYLSTTPPGATVYVDGRRYREPTPAIIRDLLPGNYSIRLVLKDHDVWSKTVPVEAAKASVLGKILLYPKKWKWIDLGQDELPESAIETAKELNKNHERLLRAQKQFQFTLDQKNILGFRFDKKGQRIVVWRKDAIGVVSLSREEKEKSLSSLPVKVDWILKGAQNISRVFWAHDGAYVVFQDQSRVLILELETFGEPSVYHLLETKGQSQISYSDDTGELFYFDKNTGNLMSLEIVPKWKVLEVPFSILKEKEKEGKVSG